MSLNEIQYKESIKLYFKPIFDALTNTTSIAQTAADSYASLQNDFDNRVALTEEYNGRATQNINIATSFGDDVGGLNSKEFRFLYGSTLKYDRVLPLDHFDVSEVVNLQTLINAVSTTNVTYLMKTGDVAAGFYVFDPDPSLPNTTVTFSPNVQVLLEGGAALPTAQITLADTSLVNRLWVENAIAAIPTPGGGGSTITVGAGSTADSGYALFGADFAMAWVTGPITYFSYLTNPVVTVHTPITFDLIYNYSLSTENAETGGLVVDNDNWYQMATAVASGNTFDLIAQGSAGNYAGYNRAKLIVIGKQVNTALTITTADKNVIMADGQTYPKLEYLSLTNSGGVAPITWAILSTDFGAAFASGYSNVAQISIPSAPGVSPGTTYPITIRATDALAATTTKVINITAIDYITVTLVITNTDQSRLADAYPIVYNFPLTSTGGVAPITWSITTHSVSLTTDPMIVTGSTLEVTFPAAGIYSVTVQAVDSAGSPQTVTKAITYTIEDYVAPPPDPCFEADETYILMADGSGKLLKDMKASDQILTISENTLKANSLGVSTTTVTSITLRPNPSGNCIKCKNIKATAGHPWTAKNDPNGNLWVRSKDIIPTTELIEVIKNDGIYSAKTTLAESISEIPPIRVAGNMTTLCSTYCVGSTLNGPWFVVHNLQLNPC